VTTQEEFFSAVYDYLDHDETLPQRPPENSSVFCGFAELK
jgi:tRNA-dihydrouridine synthase C